MWFRELEHAIPSGNVERKNFGTIFFRLIPRYTTLYHGIVWSCFKIQLKPRTRYTTLNHDFSRHQRMPTHLMYATSSCDVPLRFSVCFLCTLFLCEKKCSRRNGVFIMLGRRGAICRNYKIIPLSLRQNNQRIQRKRCSSKRMEQCSRAT